MKKFDESSYVSDLFQDEYYPNVLVSKIKTSLEKVVAYLENGGRNKRTLQSKFDTAIEEINALQDAFHKQNSELETVARDSIEQTIIDMIRHFNLEIEPASAMAQCDF